MPLWGCLETVGSVPLATTHPRADRMAKTQRSQEPGRSGFMGLAHGDQRLYHNGPHHLGAPLQIARAGNDQCRPLKVFLPPAAIEFKELKGM